MKIRTPRPTRAAALASTLVAAATVATLAGPAAPIAQAGTAQLAGPVLTVARGTTSAESSGWRFSEQYPAEFPADGFSIIVEIRPFLGAPEGISFDMSSPPVFSGPDSLHGSASFTGPRTLRIDLGTSSPGIFEAFEVTGLRLKASEDCGLGPVVSTYTNPGFAGSFGTLPPLATAGGVSPTPTPTPVPTPTPGVSPTPTVAPTPPVVAITTAKARVAAGRRTASASGFRTALVVRPGTVVTIGATVRPADAGRTVSLYRRYGTSGTWRYVTRTRIDAAGLAAVATVASLPAGWGGARQVQYRWSLAATSTATAAWSDIARVVIR